MNRRLSRRPWRLTVVVLGLLLGQSVLYSPSMFGGKILLPLDLLALPNTYLPPGSESMWRDAGGCVGRGDRV